MTDRVSKETRSRIMRSVKTRDTGPELAVRKALHSKGYRYRLHRRDLPGSPDLVFVAKRKVVFVHGCFWHGHKCPKGRLPKSRRAYWEKKIAGNLARDKRTIQELSSKGWSSLVVWQCELRSLPWAIARISAFLDRSAKRRMGSDETSDRDRSVRRRRRT